VAQREEPNEGEEKNHTGEVTKMEFSPNGKYLASASLDQSIFIWDALDGKLLHILKQDKRWDANFYFSPDSELLLTCSRKTIVMYSTSTGEIVRTLKEHTADVEVLKFSSKGQLGSLSAKEALLWDPTTWETAWVLTRGQCSHEEDLMRCTFTPDGTAFATASTDALVLTDVETGENRQVLYGPGQSIRYFEYNTSGEHVLCWSSEVARYKFDEDGTFLSNYGLGPAQVAVSPADPNVFAMTAQENAFSVQIWNLETLESIQILDEHVFLPSFFFYGTELWSFTKNEIFGFDAQNNFTRKYKFYVPKTISAMARFGNLLACGTPDGTVYHFRIQ